MGDLERPPKPSSPLTEPNLKKSKPPLPTKREDSLRTNKNSPTPPLDSLPRPPNVNSTTRTTKEIPNKEVLTSTSSSRSLKSSPLDSLDSMISLPEEVDQRSYISL